MGRENKDIGKRGEDIARHYLIAKGYKVIESNARTPFGEIDIVARQKGFIVFVEVKSRLSDSLGPPYLSITRKKMAHIIRNSLSYLKRKGLYWSSWRIDIVSVKLNNRYQAENIEHFENAVQDNGQ
ncbi:MAG TPA: YraN family protein [Candidatus Omnitrophota bacterium]|nr:YraN family protein [Candidatus Omnitrophota bacterium]